ncbi:TPA: C40 family peptidase [Klebsiella variicola subsp. variicola]|nr:C40 family peptidase [Klebsiella variicola subsp. variicola]
MRDETLKAIFEHAAAEYPRECCGVIAQKSRVEKYFPCRNITTLPNEQFELSPEDYASAEDWGTITAIVHSHPDARPIPSELDRLQCDKHLLPWVIVSWPDGEHKVIEPRGKRPLIGRPFVLGHADCWSLIMDWHKEQGIILKDYSVDYHWWETGGDLYSDNWYAEGFREVKTPRPGDMVLMQVSAKVTNHAGILLEDNMLLHHLYGQLSCRVPYAGYWRDRTIAIVRHKDLP